MITDNHELIGNWKVKYRDGSTINEEKIQFTNDKVEDYRDSDIPYMSTKYTLSNSGVLIAEDSKFESDYTLSIANNVGMLLSWFMQIVCVGIGLVLVSKGEVLIGTVIAAQSFTNNLGLQCKPLL